VGQMSFEVTIKLSTREAEAVLKSEGLSNGWGIRPSKTLQLAEMKIIGAIQTAWNEALP
jgi:hypothetical protein